MNRWTIRAFVPLIVAVVALAAVAPCAAAESPIVLNTPAGTLQGTLTIPEETVGRIPVALIIAGSGPTNRDGSNPLGVTVTPYKQLAAALAAAGIASVRYDKRGIAASAQSAPLGNPATFTSYVEDVAGWVGLLRSDQRFSRIVLVGHSEGSLLALLAAAKAPVDGVVSLEGAGRPAIELIVAQMTAAGSPPDAVARARTIGDAIRDGKDPGQVPPDFGSLFPSYLRVYEQQWFSTDPAAAAKALQAPLLVVQGGADIQVSLEDAHLLGDAHPGSMLRVYPNMAHTLMDANGTGRAASLATYTDTSLLVDPHMTAAVTAFILQRPVPPVTP